MSKLSSTSPLILGVIDDIETALIKPFEFNYRYDIGDLDGLSRSILEKGLLQPILVRNRESYYEIIAGHRRYQACRKLGWRKIICHIVELEDKDAFEISLIENIQRKTLNPIEEAYAYKNYVSNFGWGGISDLASRIGKSTSYIDKRVRLLDLPSEVVDSISKSFINPSTAEELLLIKNKNKQSELANIIRVHNLSSRNTRELIKKVNRNTVYDYDYNSMEIFGVKIINVDEKTQRSFDKSIIALRIALNKLSSIIDQLEENWIIYEILMQHKNMLHYQIDLLIREKMKL